MQAKLNIIPNTQGKQSQYDLSYKWVQENNQILQLENGIQILKFHQESLKRSPQFEFQVIQHMTQTTEHLTKLYKNPIQISYNRYKYIIPIQYSMVKLKQIENSCQEQSYINANYINTVVQEYRIIVTQGPLSQTVQHFWRMVQENKISIIYMLCNLEQKKVVKCYMYWPNKNEKILTLKNYQLELISQNEVYTNFLEKKIRIKGLNTPTDRIITHYHWKQWKDHEPPQQQSVPILNKILDLTLQHVKDKQQILVHCSAGIGRSGTFIAMLNIKLILIHYNEQLKNQKKQLKNMKLSIFGLVRRLRQQRWGMVQKRQQYQFLYEYTRGLIKEMFKIEK